MTIKEDIIQSLVLALVSIILGFWLVFLLIQLAPASSLCLTKKEARELWPKRHIYWYSRDRCWSNRRGPPRGIKIDPVIEKNQSMAQEEPKHKKRPRPKAGKTYRWNELNPIDAQADNDQYFRGEPIQLWESVMNLDPYKFSWVWDSRVAGQWEVK